MNNCQTLIVFAVVVIIVLWLMDGGVEGFENSLMSRMPDLSGGPLHWYPYVYSDDPRVFPLSYYGYRYQPLPWGN